MSNAEIMIWLLLSTVLWKTVALLLIAYATAHENGKQLAHSFVYIQRGRDGGVIVQVLLMQLCMWTSQLLSGGR